MNRTKVPCRSCGTVTNQCRYSEDSPDLYDCYVGPASPEARRKVEKGTGTEYWRHYPKGKVKVAERPSVPQDEAKASTPAAGIEQRHKSYTALLDHLKFKSEHKALVELPDVLEKLGYRSLPKGPSECGRAADVVAHTVGGGLIDWLSIPGVYVDRWTLRENVYEDGVLQEEEYWDHESQSMQRRPKTQEAQKARLALMDYESHGGGFLVPSRTAKGEVQALRVRLVEPLDGTKYRWYRGAEGEGSAVGQCAHVAILAKQMSECPKVVGTWPYNVEAIRLTEGEKKADIASYLTGVLTIGLPGVSSHGLADPVIRECLPKGGPVLIAFDQETEPRAKRAVAQAMTAKLLALYDSPKYPVCLEVWSPEQKGIDDLLVAGGRPDVLVGLPALKYCQEQLRQAGAPANPELDARITLIEAWENRDELGLDFTKMDAVMDALVVMGGRGGYEDAWEGLAKEAKALTPYKKALAAAGSRAKKAEKEEQQAKAEEEAKAEGKILFERGDNAEIAAVLKEGYRGKGLVYDEGYCWTYNKEEGIWVQVPREKLSRSVQGLAGSPIRGRERGLSVNSTREPIGMLQDLVAKPQFFSSAPRGITFSNTFLAITEKGLETVPLDPRQGSRHRYDFEYDPEAKPEEFEKKLFDWFGRDYEGPELVEDKLEKDEDTKARVQYVQEFLGLSLIGMATKLAKRTLILVGDGANGKSTLQDIIRGCFPPGSTCGVKPQNWSHDQMVERLVGKRLNMVGELPSRDLQDSDVYKGVVTGDLEIEVNPKHRTPYGFYATAGHIMNTNGLFASGDNSHAFHRRNVVMEMHKQYLEAQQDNGLVDRILAKERGAIVAWMIEGAKRAIERGKICKVPQSSVESQETWKTQSDAVRRWLLAKLKGRLILDPKTAPTADYQSDRDALFLPFDRWAKANRHGQMSSSKFQERFRIAVKELARAATSHPEFWGLLDDNDQPRPPTKEEQRALDQITQYGLRRIGNLRKCPVELMDGADLSADCEDLVGDV